MIIFIQLLNALLGYIALKFIATYMSPWEYGVIGFAYGFVALFSIFGKLGFDQAHIKRVSEGKDLGKCIATFAVTKTLLAGVMASIVIISIAIWKFLLHRGFESPLHEQAIYIMLVYFFLLTITQSFISTFNARKESAKAQIPL
ncbi:MAG: flippase, partial [Spirochaetes bacterium]